MQLPTTTLVLWPRPLVSGLHMIRLRVTYGRKSRYYSTGATCTPQQWDAQFCRIKPASHKHNTTLSAVESRAAMVAQQYQIRGEVFDWADFESAMWGRENTAKNRPKVTVFDLLQQAAQNFEAQEKFSSAGLRRAAAKYLHQHWPGLTVCQLTQDWYNAFVASLQTRFSRRTVLNYCLCVHQALRHARKAKMLAPDFEAYETDEVRLHMPLPNKRAIGMDEFERIKQVPLPPGSDHEWARDMFVLSFLLRGINLADLAELQKGATASERLEYGRRKTGAFFSVPVTDEVRAIAERWPGPGPYLLAIYPRVPANAKDAYAMRMAACKAINRTLRQVLRDMGAQLHTFYTARHTFATALDRRGVSLGAISKALGHKNLTYTQMYLKDFGDAEVDAAVDAALAV